MRKLSLLLTLIALALLAGMPLSAQEEATPEVTPEMTAEALPGGSMTIGELVIGAAGDVPAQFTGLLAAIEAADPTGLEALTSPATQVTVFAPSDAAFADWQEFVGEEFSQVMASPAVLTNILTFHIVPGVYTVDDLTGLLDVNEGRTVTLPTLNGQYIDISGSTGGSILINGAPLNMDMANISASNGIVHVIDAVVFPDDRTIDQIIVEMAGDEETPEFTTLLSALSAANPAVLEALADPDAELTLFAPTDTAFALLDADTLNDILQDQQTLTSVLLYHVVNGRIYAADFSAQLNSGTAPAWSAGLAEDGSLQIITAHPDAATATLTTEGGTFINGAQVVLTNIDAVNGVIHVIDAVLMPGQ